MAGNQITEFIIAFIHTSIYLSGGKDEGVNATLNDWPSAWAACSKGKTADRPTPHNSHVSTLDIRAMDMKLNTENVHAQARRTRSSLEGVCSAVETVKTKKINVCFFLKKWPPPNKNNKWQRALHAVSNNHSWSNNLDNPVSINLRSQTQFY